MDIRHENTDELNALLTVRIESADYEEKVAQKLKDYRRKAQIKGFRPGNAPESLISRMYRMPLLVDEVNKLISESISKYIDENQLKILGEPLPSESHQPIDWEKSKDFEFRFDLGLMPKFEVKLSQKDKLPFYSIKVDKDIRQKYIESIVNRFGEYIDTDTAKDNSLLKASITELDQDENPKEIGLTLEDVSIAMTLVADKQEQAKLLGTKVGDVIVIDTHKAFPDAAGRAALLRVDKDELGNHNPLFRLTLTEVKEYKVAEVNQSLFDKAFGPGVVNSEEEFNAKVDEAIKGNLRGDSEQRFAADMRKALLQKCRVELPKQFLVRWLVAINEGKYTPEQVEKDYGNFEEDLKWQLIRDHIATQQDISIKEEEVEALARTYVTLQMQQYGMGQLPESFLEGYTADLLKKQKERKRFAEGVLENKVVAWVKEVVKLDEKEVNFEEFKSIMSEGKGE